MSFAADTAEKTGRERKTVERNVARGNALGGDLKRVAGISLYKDVELDALERDGIHYVAMARAVENLGIDWPSQSAKLLSQRFEVQVC